MESPIFTEPPRVEPCTFAECLAGHKWPPRILVVQCPGDSGPYLAVQQGNCPVCNEPQRLVRLRVDFVPTGSGAQARCKGATPYGESIDVEMVRQGDPADFKTFTDREASRAASAANPTMPNIGAPDASTQKDPVR